AELGQARAVEVLEVAPGEPAVQAGLRAGDLLLRANGQPVGSVDDLVRTLVLTDGAELELEVWRGQQTLKLALMPASPRRKAA
ncbi:MAG TPA: PDZ domain-containing protein, partial [Polyangiaceae bacterium]|nr:PDZ domain-containing protein [Polyangiaceae bacterium]